MPSVFLSHSSKDKAFTRKLAERLTLAGVRVWLDEAEINIGDSLLTKISTAIETTDFVAVIISHNSVQSSWVQSELQMAMSRELSEKQVRLLPIVIEPCELPMFLRDKLYADFSKGDDFDAPFARLLRALGVDRQLSDISPQSAPRVPENKQPSKSEPERLDEFTDIEITGVDKDRTYNPDPQKALFNVYFTLSAYPPQDWGDIFEAERRFPRHTMWRKAWVEGNSIAVYCVPDEVKKYHLGDIKTDVASSNAKYREYLHRRETRRAHEAQKQLRQRDALNNALDDLDI
ncbi:toll/interleukin-1 receptor domain-containing protein [Nevskia sp.]|uniref:toll/interleukin-1 receptor domain-containing protein n=1 Tax=Nevskia sp. TaxID=1929292 RepID=UPI0025E99FC4|nr:toll/interleukin-1 receptor domain-containing protein [Nevskia sp.]